MENLNKENREIDWRNRSRELLDSLNIGYVLVDMNENILDVNETLLKMTGTAREDIVGRNNRDLFTPEEFEKLRQTAVPLQDNFVYQFEFPLPTANGKRIPVLYNSFINVGPEGLPESINVMVTDIREQKKTQKELESMNRTLALNREILEKEKKKLETILFGIGDCVTIFDTDGKILLSTPQGERIRGRRKRPFVPLGSESKREITISIGSQKRQYQVWSREIRDEQEVTFAFVEILKDITDHVRLEQKEQELKTIKREMRRSGLQQKMIGRSRMMEKVFDLILRCAEVDSTILILGETGVGKELVARAIHEQSGRHDKPFVAVNCGAFMETLLESEMFGHEKGAFTGAISNQLGLFREATGGTLFLDEVGELSGPLQVKLLRALQEKEIRPVGSGKTFPVDVRVIAATNRDLAERVRENRFRKDLYYRIAVIPIIVPALRERKDDILLLAEHFIKKHMKKGRKSLPVLDHSAQQRLIQYDWPGNIRELENCMEHALAMARNSKITAENLPFQIAVGWDATEEEPRLTSTSTSTSTHSPPVNVYSLESNSNRPPSGLSGRIEKREADIIKDALYNNRWNQSLVAKELGISRTTLWRRIRKYGIEK